MDTSKELAAIPARLAALVAGEPDAGTDEGVRDADAEGVYDGLSPSERERLVYRDRLAALVRELENLLDEQDGTAQAWRDEQARKAALTEEEQEAEHEAWLAGIRSRISTPLLEA